MLAIFISEMLYYNRIGLVVIPMVSWIWMPVMFLVGAIMGVIITSVIAYDNIEYYKNRKEWDEDE